MKHFVLGLSVLFLAHAASAAKLQAVSHLQNPNLESLSAAGSADKPLLQSQVHIAAPSSPGVRSAAQVRQAEVEQAAHQLCGFFDDGVKVSQVANSAQGASSAVSYLFGNTPDDENAMAAMNAALVAAVGSPIEIYSGDASGNNTVGTVLGIYDLAHDEILVFSSTNCGSDD